MRFSTLWASTAALFLLGGCALKEYERSEPKLITLKTQQLRYNDVGFIRTGEDGVQAELFSAGQVVERFEIGRLVCVTKGCMTKSAFNGDYLHADYPDDLLRNVLTGRPIFKSAGLHRTDAGFEQQVKTVSVDIDYSVEPGNIDFNDRANHILIRIRDLPPQPEPKP